MIGIGENDLASDLDQVSGCQGLHTRLRPDGHEDRGFKGSMRGRDLPRPGLGLRVTMCDLKTENFCSRCHKMNMASP